MIFVLSFLSITFMDWLTVISVIFLCIFCIYLYYNNRKLNQIIDELRSRDKYEYEKNVLKEDIVDIEDISYKMDNIDIGVRNCKASYNDNIEEKKNVAVDIDNIKVKKSKLQNDDVKNNMSISDNNKFVIEDFIMKDKYISRKLDNSDMNSEYLSEISKEIESNMVPQTIKLTDYEQQQEDNAIISYKELLNINNRDEVINDDTVEFIEELKKFRNNLGR